MTPPLFRRAFGERSTDIDPDLLEIIEARGASSQPERLLALQNRRARMRMLQQRHLQAVDPEEDAEQPSDTSSSDENTEDRSSESDSSSGDEKKKKKLKKAKKDKKDKKKRAGARAVDIDGTMDLSRLATLLATISKPAPTSAVTSSAPLDTMLSDPLSIPPPPSLSSTSASATEIAQQVVQLLKQEEQSDQKKTTTAKIGSKVAFKRVDQVYDRKIHNYKLKETVQGDTEHDKWDQVRATLYCAAILANSE